MRRTRTAISDFHIHSPYCGHAHGKIVDYIENAIKKGIKEICFTDHLDRYYLTKSQKKRYWNWGMDEKNLSRYIVELEDCRATYNKEIKVRIGLEIDYIEGAEELLKPIIEEYPFDFLLGSIHCLPSYGWRHLAQYSFKDSWPIFEAYFKTAKALISADIFDSFAHIDFIWRYTKWPYKKTKKVFDYIGEIIRTATSYSTAIEINSNGYLWSEIYNIRGEDPFIILLNKIEEYNVPITIGSDAHKPEYVGKTFDSIAQKLKNSGITNYFTFNKRRGKSNRIP